jgi:hypothetical protein
MRLILITAFMFVLLVAEASALQMISGSNVVSISPDQKGQPVLYAFDVVNNGGVASFFNMTVSSRENVAELLNETEQTLEAGDKKTFVVSLKLPDDAVDGSFYLTKITLKEMVVDAGVIRWNANNSFAVTLFAGRYQESIISNPVESVPVVITENQNEVSDNVYWVLLFISVIIACVIAIFLKRRKRKRKFY